ncbi:uncharacterized protein J8A68_004226 [[Candida] subhashii]|uniref:Transmembrane 9 superfamily member n=1 Tax=[Candida] subhashii TaxID=561895 RepID=A0A8J5QJI5_9ASCO|nr:uncharacterized protein J8A68_004226 [[Candida] subhashii]KAG7662216.1 hypothetical protein J8A68_004226 [[Candida] subhashii]
MLFVIYLTCFLLQTVHAINLGWNGPHYYQIGEKVDLLVNKIESDTTQLPFSYYNLPFVCPPMNGAKPVHLSLGEILRGDRIWQSGYDLHFGIDVPCNRLCDLRATERHIKKASQLIKNGYVVHWSLDGLPGATTFESSHRNNKYYAAGFPLGFVKNDISYIYNHVMLVIRYHRQKENNNQFAIVGFEVYPKSVINEECPGSSKNYKNFALKYKTGIDGQLNKQKTIIPYTYSVYWREDNSIDYDSRWDLYYENENKQANVHIHWLSFINSIILIFLGSLVVLVVLLKVLKNDIQKDPSTSPLPLHTDHHDHPDSPTSASNRNWKELINEIDRVPHAVLILITLVSGGVQMLIAVVGVITIFVLNSIGSKNTFFNTHEGSFFTFSIFCFIGSGFISSYGGIILYKLFKGDDLNQPYDINKAIILSFLFSATLPSILFIVILFLNFFVWAKDSSSALPFGTIVVLLLLFILLQCPLGIIGGLNGNNHKFNLKKSSLLSPPIDQHDRKFPSTLSPPYTPPTLPHANPTHPANIASTIITYFRRVLIYGLVPFGIVYVELLFIFNSVWLEKTTFYYMYGFLFVTTIMEIIIIAESAIVAIYINLSVYNDPNWHWLSFQVGTSIGWYIYAYSVYYFFTVLNVGDFVSRLLYFFYMALACFVIGITCGSVGVLTGLGFVRRIHRAVEKVD